MPKDKKKIIGFRASKEDLQLIAELSERFDRNQSEIIRSGIIFYHSAILGKIRELVDKVEDMISDDTLEKGLSEKNEKESKIVRNVLREFVTNLEMFETISYKDMDTRLVKIFNFAINAMLGDFQNEEEYPEILKLTRKTLVETAKFVKKNKKKEDTNQK